MRANPLTLPILLILALVPLSTAAQPPERGHRPRDQEPPQRFEHLAEFLELSESQAVEIEAMLENQRQVWKTHRASLRAAHEELAELVRADAPDATVIGEKVLAVDAMKTSLRADAERRKEAMRALLTAEQLERFEAFEAARAIHDTSGRRGRHGHRAPRPLPGDHAGGAPDPRGS